MSKLLRLLELPWVFTQTEPLEPRNFIREAGRRGLRLTIDDLERLHLAGSLSPLVEVCDEEHHQPAILPDEPRSHSTRRVELRRAQSLGRVRDPATTEVGSEAIRFERRETDPPRWWSGLLYSRWQLLDPPGIAKEVERLRSREQPLRIDGSWGQRARRLSGMLTVLEARYLPVVEDDWMSLRGADEAEWDAYRSGFDAHAVLADLGEKAPDLQLAADGLLHRARSLDETGQWSDLIRRAPRRSWDSLEGGVLSAMELRIAAEILMLFHADLGSGAGEPSPRVDERLGWTPARERLSYRGQELDSILMRLGISPHPGVYLIVEGETEFLLMERVFDHLCLSRRPDLLRVVCSRGADKELALLAAATIGPVLGRRRENSYELVRPPSKLLITVDRDRRWETEDNARKQKLKILDALNAVVRAQGAQVDRIALAQLVEVHRWDGRCFEFAHFTDAELLRALRRLWLDASEWPGDDVVLARIAEVRGRGWDVKEVWKTWRWQPPKPDLADSLWVELRRKIDEAESGETPYPEIAEVAFAAYHDAQNFSRGTFFIGAHLEDGRAARGDVVDQ